MALQVVVTSISNNKIHWPLSFFPFQITDNFTQSLGMWRNVSSERGQKLPKYFHWSGYITCGALSYANIALNRCVLWIDKDHLGNGFSTLSLHYCPWLSTFRAVKPCLIFLFIESIICITHILNGNGNTKWTSSLSPIKNSKRVQNNLISSY